MTQKLQYVIDENGEQVGVLLDIAEYRRLQEMANVDENLLTGLSAAELRALAESKLAPAAQDRVDNLLAGNAADQLVAEECAELDQLLAQIDQLTLLKTRARYTLGRQQSLTPAA